MNDVLSIDVGSSLKPEYKKIPRNWSNSSRTHEVMEVHTLNKKKLIQITEGFAEVVSSSSFMAYLQHSLDKHSKLRDTLTPARSSYAWMKMKISYLYYLQTSCKNLLGYSSTTNSELAEVKELRFLIRG